MVGFDKGEYETAPVTDEIRKRNPHLALFMEWRHALNKESDRGAVLISASMLEDLLGRCIQAKLVDHPDVPELLKGFNAPLGSFSSRTLAALALGILNPDEYEDLKQLRAIRNLFAHGFRTTFADQAVASRCSQFKNAVRIEHTENPVKAQFMIAALALIVGLTGREVEIEKARLSGQKWLPAVFNIGWDD